MRKALSPELLASHSITKGLVKSGNRRTGGVVTAFLRFRKAVVAVGDQRKAFFFKRAA
jgi:hypothetical protein